LYDTAPLRQTLQEVVDLDRLNRDSRVVVTAVNVATGEVANFGNARAIEEGRQASKQSPFPNAGGLSLDHVLASGSIPPSFPPTRVEGGSFWDGALYMNTPLSEAINCLERCDRGSLDVEREVIVVELYPMPGSLPANIQEVVSRFFSIIFSSKLVLDEELFGKVNAYIDLARRIDEFLGKVPKKSPLRAEAEAIRGHEGYVQLTGHRPINAFTKISLASHPELADASDFSKATIEARIKAGYEAAVRQEVGEPHPVASPQVTRG
jgi:predicted acylesterase/phospholipase RssA